MQNLALVDWRPPLLGFSPINMTQSIKIVEPPKTSVDEAVLESSFFELGIPFHQMMLGRDGTIFFKVEE